MCALILIGLFSCFLSHNKARHPLSPKSRHRSLIPDSQSTTVPTSVAHLNSPLFRLSGTFVRQGRSEVKDRPRICILFKMFLLGGVEVLILHVSQSLFQGSNLASSNEYFVVHWVFLLSQCRLEREQGGLGLVVFQCNSTSLIFFRDLQSFCLSS